MKENEEKMGWAKQEHSYISWIFIGAALLIIVAFLVWIFTNGKETRVSQEQTYSSITSLNCTAPSQEKSFFSSDSATDIKHNLKIVLQDDKIDSISYSYDATFNSDKEAENATAVLHGKYNMYMDEQGANRESYNPVFAQDKTRLKISIYAENKKLVSAMAPILFMTNDEFANIKNYNTEDFEKIYDGKGFTCEVRD